MMVDVLLLFVAAFFCLRVLEGLGLVERVDGFVVFLLLYIGGAVTLIVLRQFGGNEMKGE